MVKLWYWFQAGDQRAKPSSQTQHFGLMFNYHTQRKSFLKETDIAIPFTDGSLSRAQSDADFRNALLCVESEVQPVWECFFISNVDMLLLGTSDVIKNVHNKWCNVLQSVENTSHFISPVLKLYKYFCVFIPLQLRSQHGGPTLTPRLAKTYFRLSMPLPKSWTTRASRSRELCTQVHDYTQESISDSTIHPRDDGGGLHHSVKGCVGSAILEWGRRE